MSQTDKFTRFNRLMEENEGIRKAYCLAVFCMKALGNATSVTDIGTKKGGLLVIGYQHNRNESIVDIVSQDPIPLISSKFSTSLTELIGLMTKYSTEIGLTDEALALFKVRLTDYIEDRLIIVPFQHGRTLNGVFEEPIEVGGELEYCREDVVVKGYKYTYDKDTFKPIYSLILGSKSVYNTEKGLTDFGKGYTDIYNRQKATHNNQLTVHFSNYGYIYTPVLSCEEQEVIIDNTNVYWSTGQGQALRIIGKLIDGGVEYYKTSEYTIPREAKLFKALDYYAPYIARYRDYIVPYGLTGTNKIEIGANIYE